MEIAHSNSKLCNFFNDRCPHFVREKLEIPLLCDDPDQPNTVLGIFYLFQEVGSPCEVGGGTGLLQPSISYLPLRHQTFNAKEINPIIIYIKCRLQESNSLSFLSLLSLSLSLLYSVKKLLKVLCLSKMTWLTAYVFPAA